MKIINYPSDAEVSAILGTEEPLLVLISFDEETIIIGAIEEAVEHHILLQKVGLSGNDVDKYYRIVLDDEGADWTFVCPANYQNITDKTKRIAAFYKNGFRVISDTMAELGYFVSINISKRYRRHFDIMSK